MTADDRLEHLRAAGQVFSEALSRREDLSLYVWWTSRVDGLRGPNKAMYAKRVAAALAYVGWCIRTG